MKHINKYEDFTNEGSKYPKGYMTTKEFSKFLSKISDDIKISMPSQYNNGQFDRMASTYYKPKDAIKAVKSYKGKSDLKAYVWSTNLQYMDAKKLQISSQLYDIDKLVKSLDDISYIKISFEYTDVDWESHGDAVRASGPLD